MISVARRMWNLKGQNCSKLTSRLEKRCRAMQESLEKRKKKKDQPRQFFWGNTGRRYQLSFKDPYLKAVCSFGVTKVSNRKWVVIKKCFVKERRMVLATLNALPVFNCVYSRFLLNDSLSIEDHYCKLQSSLHVHELLRRSLISVVCASVYWILKKLLLLFFKSIIHGRKKESRKRFLHLGVLKQIYCMWCMWLHGQFKGSVLNLLINDFIAI